MKIFRCGEVYSVVNGDAVLPYSGCEDIDLEKGVKFLSGPMKTIVEDAIASRKVLQREFSFEQIAARSFEPVKVDD